MEDLDEESTSDDVTSGDPKRVDGISNNVQWSALQVCLKVPHQAAGEAFGGEETPFSPSRGRGFWPNFPNSFLSQIRFVHVPTRLPPRASAAPACAMESGLLRQNAFSRGLVRHIEAEWRTLR